MVGSAEQQGSKVPEVTHLITHGGLVAALPPVVLRYRFLKRMLKFGRQLVSPHALRCPR